MALLPIYLDYHATTPVDPLVLEAMLPFFSERFGNAASKSHPFGWQAEAAVDLARQKIASLLSVTDKEIYFTSGATEGLNLLIKGTAEKRANSGRHIVSVQTEHHAVLDSLAWLEKKGFEITLLPVDALGRLDLQQFADALSGDTIFACVMWANNETGVIQDMQTLGAICRDAGVPLISDATQAVGKIPVDPVEAGVDMLVFSAHKFYGPKGVGGVYISSKHGIKPLPLIHGGGHEGGLRSGTLNVPGIAGMGKAAELFLQKGEAERLRLQHLRDGFEQAVLSALTECARNGDHFHRLPTVSNLLAKYTESQGVMTGFRSRLAIATGSACSSADPSPSHVLLAMGRSEEEAKASYRFSFGGPTSVEEVESAAAIFIDRVLQWRSESPAWQLR